MKGKAAIARGKRRPQAQNDFLSVQRCASYGSTLTIGSVDQLLRNDRGGAAKSFLGLKGAEASGRLAVQGVGEIYVDPSGSILLNPSSDFKGGTIYFDYIIQLGKGAISTARVAADIPRQEVINFDLGDNLVVPNGYMGLDWQNFGVIDHQDPPQPNGYNLIGEDYEGDWVALNSGGYPAEAKSANANHDFDFVTGVFAAAWHTNLNLEIKAYDDGLAVGLAKLIINPAITQVDFSQKQAKGAVSAEFSGRFESIDRITFDSFGGEPSLGNGTQIATDDWIICYAETHI